MRDNRTLIGRERIEAVGLEEGEAVNMPLEVRISDSDRAGGGTPFCVRKRGDSAALIGVGSLGAEATCWAWRASRDRHDLQRQGRRKYLYGAYRLEHCAKTRAYCRLRRIVHAEIEISTTEHKA